MIGSVGIMKHKIVTRYSEMYSKWSQKSNRSMVGKEV